MPTYLTYVFKIKNTEEYKKIVDSVGDLWSFASNSNAIFKCENYVIENEKLKSKIEKLQKQLYAQQQLDKTPLKCDICGMDCPDPWHFSAKKYKHLHACDACWSDENVKNFITTLK